MTGSVRRRVFKLLVANPMLALYDDEFNEIQPEVSDGERRMYKIRGYWSEKLEMYVTPVVFVVEVRDGPFKAVVDELRCVDGVDRIYNGVLCINGAKRLRTALVAWNRRVLKTFVEKLL